MNKLEKTKRISISAVIFLLVIVIALLTFRRPKHVFSKDAKSTLKEMLGKDYVITTAGLKAMDTASYVLVDVRSSYEYNKGHHPKAINIANNEVLNDDNIQFFKSLEEGKKMAVLYSENPNNALGTWMTLYQLGYENSKILAIETDYTNKVFVAKDVQIEKPAVNYAATLDSLKTKKQAPIVETVKVIKKKEAPKAVVPVEKKKKSAPEGGC
jgi:rhodanese-related sulfurtransferase